MYGKIDVLKPINRIIYVSVILRNHRNQFHNNFLSQTRLFCGRVGIRSKRDSIHSAKYLKCFWSAEPTLQPILRHRPMSSLLQSTHSCQISATRLFSTGPPDKDTHPEGNISIEYEEKALSSDVNVEAIKCAKAMDESDLPDHSNVISMRGDM